ncbi:MAG: ribonuclease R [Candidatus Firestonebacteria bacterium]
MEWGFKSPLPHKKRITRIKERIAQMKKGEIIKIKGDKYEMALTVGILQGHPKGFGFVKLEDSDDEVYISNANINEAMHGDKVVVRIVKVLRGKNKEGEITRILKRANENVVGVFEESKHFGFVIPDDKKIWHNIYIHKSLSMGAKNAQKVVVRITEWPREGNNPEGQIIEIIGYKNAPDVDLKALIRQYNLSEEFPQSVIRESGKINGIILEEEICLRKDFREENIFTIDGEDAKDFDDAVSISKIGKNEFKLGVHIADVSYYVKEDSSIDEEALKRGNSIYFLNKVIPMLPEVLSNEMCSLKPNEDRLTISVLMDIDNDGHVKTYKICKSIIRSKRRLTYNLVAKMVEEKDETLRNQYKDVTLELDVMFELAKVLYNKRVKDGSLDFDLPETKVVLDKDGYPVRVVKIIRNWAQRIIEEFMLMANEIIATHIFKSKSLSIYRIHEVPDYEDIVNFSKFVKALGYNFKISKNLHSKDLQNLLKSCKDTSNESVINRMALRSLKLAIYSTNPICHFALAKKYYTHFTSPIRRYPDLVVHRILLNRIKSKTLSKIAKHCSETERLAEKVEEEITKIKKIQLIRNNLGKVYSGIISGVESYGLFVEIDDLQIDGLVHVSNLVDDYYIYDEKLYTFIGRRKNKRYRLGDSVKVKVMKVDLDKKQIDLQIVS